MKQFHAALSLMVCAAASVGCQGSVAQDDGQGGEAGASPPGAAPGPIDVERACKSGANVGAGKWRRLTTAQYEATVRDLLGFQPDTKGFLLDTTTGPFATNTELPPQDTDVEKYSTTAEGLASKAVANLATLINCDTKATGEDKCATEFIKTFGARAFRRPLTSAEEAAFTKLYTVGKEESFATGIRLVVEASLQSPSFLYLVEQGESSKSGLAKLTDYEVATRLSYTLTGTMPDAPLFAAAKAGKLSTVDGIREQADRLMSTTRFVDTAAKFHVQLLGFDALTRSGVVTKEAGKFPDFDDVMRAAMADEPTKFVNYVLTKGSGTVEELLSAPYVFPFGPLAKVYGPDAKADAEGRAEVRDGSRMGLLTLAGVQASSPHVPTKYAAVIRGHLVRRELLCTPVPPPNVAVKFEPPPNADQLTQQELLRVHQENPTCKGCHELMDPIGFGFEHYDLIGRWKAKNADGTDINSSGQFIGIDGEPSFGDTQEMLRALSTMTEVRSCLGTQWFRFALARDPETEDACTEGQIQQALLDGKGNLKDAILSLVSSDSFRNRRGQ
ncbi:MAG: DUF1592 domain-containing protein [Deltaproteobacteria bacterium]|nr:DUF1592 domain-containing protein [Deltaproteobacteria bacterium]